MSREKNIDIELIEYLGNSVDVIIDRPMNSLHPKYLFEYPINYGYVPHTISGDGEEIDAYVLGVTHPIKQFSGKVIAIVIRHDDIENKLIVSNSPFSRNEIIKLIHFQEQYFNIDIVTLL